MEPSRESREFWREGRQHPQFGAPGNEFDLAGLRRGMGTRQHPANREVRCIRLHLDGMPCEWVVAPGADPDVRLLYLHGGGYVSGSGANYLPLAADLSAAAGCAVLLPDYRLAPEAPFPAGLEDCIRAYEWMTGAGPYGSVVARATFIAGDSAGGGLTLATLLALRDCGRTLPHGAIPMSAFADLTLASASIRSQAENELYMHPRCLPEFVKLYLRDHDAHDPLVSPVFGDYTGIPPLLIQVGEYEVIRDDSIRVAEKARADGAGVQLEVWPGQVHVFQIRGLPESREAIAHIGSFIRHICASRATARGKWTHNKPFLATTCSRARTTTLDPERENAMPNRSTSRSLLSPSELGNWRLTAWRPDGRMWALDDGVFHGSCSNTWVGHSEKYSDCLLECEILYDGYGAGDICVRGDRDAHETWEHGYNFAIGHNKDRSKGRIILTNPKGHHRESVEFNLNEWTKLTISAVGKTIQAYVNPEHRLSIVDNKNCFPSGHICLSDQSCKEGENSQCDGSGHIKYRHLVVQSAV